MPFSSIDRTLEVESLSDGLTVKSTDYCSYFIKHPDTFLQRKECWTCIYSEFGIATGYPTYTGICKHQKKE